MSSSLPINISKKTDARTNLYFDTYYSRVLNLADNDLNTVVAFFETQGFERSAAIAVSNVLLQQAKNENIKIFKLLDTLKKYSGTQLSSVVAEILNYDRKRTSVIGYRKEQRIATFESRNIIEGNPINFTTGEITSDKDLSSTETTLDSELVTIDGE
jgi:hypothetical protein